MMDIRTSGKKTEKARRFSRLADALLDAYKDGEEDEQLELFKPKIHPEKGDTVALRHLNKTLINSLVLRGIYIVDLSYILYCGGM